MTRRVTVTGLGDRREAAGLVVAVREEEVLAVHLEGDQHQDLEDSQKPPLVKLPRLHLQRR